MLLTKIPTSKFSKTVFPTKTEVDHMPGILQCQLFHHCMQIVFEPMKTDQQAIHTVIDHDGNTCRCLAVLMAWIADLKEQYDIVGLAMNSCPRCLAGYEDLECPNPCPIHTGQSIINELQCICTELPVRSTTWQFASRARVVGLAGVEKLCWEGLGVDIC
jgi:Plavaka transposase